MKKNWVLSLLVVSIVLVLAGCGSGNSVVSTKGTYKDPYSLEDSFEFVAGDVVPFSHLQPGGRQITNPIKLRISNIQVKQWTVTEFKEYSDYWYGKNGKDNEHYYFVTYDVEIAESDVFEAVDLSFDYFSVYCLGADGQQAQDTYSPDDLPDGLTDGLTYRAPTVVPLEGKSWGCYTWLAPKDEEELDYIMFNYCGEDGEFHDIYVKVD